MTTDYNGLSIVNNTQTLFVGEGAFGKVYTAINCDTNCMMAMKEVSSGDSCTITVYIAIEWVYCS